MEQARPDCGPVAVVQRAAAGQGTLPSLLLAVWAALRLPSRRSTVPGAAVQLAGRAQHRPRPQAAAAGEQAAHPAGQHGQQQPGDCSTAGWRAGRWKLHCRRCSPQPQAGARHCQLDCPPAGHRLHCGAVRRRCGRHSGHWRRHGPCAAVVRWASGGALVAAWASSEVICLKFCPTRQSAFTASPGCTHGCSDTHLQHVQPNPASAPLPPSQSWACILSQPAPPAACWCCSAPLPLC